MGGEARENGGANEIIRPADLLCSLTSFILQGLFQIERRKIMGWWNLATRKRPGARGRPGPGTRIGLGLLVVLAALAAVGVEAADFDARRQDMMTEIEQDVRMTRRELGKASLDARVLQALAWVPRHEFVPETQRAYAYENRPLPIGFGQTISQPYIVAIMTDLLALPPRAKVFELGTGSGYQAAVLGELGARVYTMEIVPELGERARATLHRLGYADVTVRIGDGYYGWEEHAPFDAIIVTAAGDHIPPPLIQQLKPGGRLIIPVGSRFFTQQLVLLEKTADGAVRSREILPVAFVPLTREP
jgi:protein-L-isoaspartate(D-aspartate) O-methyltransferase